MIVTDKKTANAYDVVIRTGRFPLQGRKCVITKGTTKISFPISDLYDAINALEDIAHSVDGTTSGFRAP
jgi:hypothetical protein